jgi:hypothetical protein
VAARAANIASGDQLLTELAVLSAAAPHAAPPPLLGSSAPAQHAADPLAELAAAAMPMCAVVLLAESYCLWALATAASSARCIAIALGPPLGAQGTGAGNSWP